MRRYVPDGDTEGFVRLVESALEVHPDPVDPPRISRDPNDDYLVALALASDAEAIVSGDRDLTRLRNSPVEVMTARQFVDRFGGFA
jgi:putative PIN family toxin of toxin-antitoxin system